MKDYVLYFEESVQDEEDYIKCFNESIDKYGGLIVRVLMQNNRFVYGTTVNSMTIQRSNYHFVISQREKDLITSINGNLNVNLLAPRAEILRVVGLTLREIVIPVNRTEVEDEGEKKVIFHARLTEDQLEKQLYTEKIVKQETGINTLKEKAMVLLFPGFAFVPILSDHLNDKQYETLKQLSLLSFIVILFLGIELDSWFSRILAVNYGINLTNIGLMSPVQRRGVLEGYGLRRLKPIQYKQIGWTTFC